MFSGRVPAADSWRERASWHGSFGADNGMIGFMDSEGHMTLAGDDPLAIELALAIHGGDMATLTRLIGEHPGIESARVGDAKGWRTPLHMVADWPGYFPNGPQTVRILVAAGADPNDQDPVKGDESPLHWAASSDDEEVAAALINAGADITCPTARSARRWPTRSATAAGRRPAASRPRRARRDPVGGRCPRRPRAGGRTAGRRSPARPRGYRPRVLPGLPGRARPDRAGPRRPRRQPGVHAGVLRPDRINVIADAGPPGTRR